MVSTSQVAIAVWVTRHQRPKGKIDSISVSIFLVITESETSWLVKDEVKRPEARGLQLEVGTRPVVGIVEAIW